MIGTTLGHYQIVEKLGEGGMGEVYRATDTALGRDVAIKVLPAEFAQDAERLARFEREAKTLASLNHRNIATIYGLQKADASEGSGPTRIRALVMELIEGPTLADRVAEGAIPIGETLAIAEQIADALEAAHGLGIVHRDLKPANVKVRPDGTVKVLDFGLAKIIEPTSGTLASASLSPTITMPAMTQAGAILGTAAYMSPEQVKGRSADKRADVWAFGCVLFEMLTGKRAFAADADTIADTVAAILKTEPEWNALRHSTPVPIRRLLRRCLTKDPRARLHDIADARLEIHDARTGDPDGARADQKSHRLEWGIVAALAVLSLVLASLLARARSQPPASEAAYQSVILPPAGDPDAAAAEARTAVPRFARGLALSADGRRLAFVAPGPDGRFLLWVRPLDGSVEKPLPGSEGATSPFWSPDGRYIGFVADRKLKRIDASGGPALTLFDGARNFSKGTWNRDNVILIAGDGPILRISAGAAGGTASPVTAPDLSTESGHFAPFFLPDGRHFVYSVARSGSSDGGALYVGTLDSREHSKLRDGGRMPAYASGYLLFVSESTLMAQRFDPDRLQMAGEALPLVNHIQVGGAPSSTGAYAVSETGVLVYQPGAHEKSTLVWIGQDGKELAVLSDPQDFSYVQLSPNQRQVAVSVMDDASSNRDLWIFDATRRARTRFTDVPTDDFAPAWSPNSDRLAFIGRRAEDRGLNLYEKSSNGAGEKRLLDRDGLEIPTSWSSDGQFILFQTEAPAADIWVLPLAAGSAPLPFANTRFNEASAQFSPDDRWIAYSSNETGRTEVYVAPFRRTGARVPISTEGGGSPRWRADGRELFYIRGDNTLMAVPLRAGESSIDVGTGRPLFHAQFRNTALPYAVASDGRFLVNRSIDDAAPTPITLVVNWPATLRK